jgi:nicotinamide mononucleotide adenylyltransferase
MTIQLELTAVFIGKFQPPHFGHLMTAKRLMTKYKSIVIAVTDGRPNIMPPKSVLAMFKEVLGEKGVTYKHILGAVDEGTAIFDFDFDVICSGNPLVLELLKNNGLEVEFVERAYDNYFTGTSIRNSYINQSMHESNTQIASFDIVDTAWLKPIEKVFPSHLLVLENAINLERCVRTPLIVDNETGAVLDGSHRYAFLLKNGYQKAPVLLVDYSNESIFVGNQLSHRFKFSDSKILHKDNIRARAIQSELLEPRSTRHFFPFRKEEIPTSLNSLDQTNPCDITHLITSYSTSQQIKANQNYIAEVQEELDIIKEYEAEQIELKKYLLSHIKSIAELDKDEK